MKRNFPSHSNIAVLKNTIKNCLVEEGAAAWGLVMLVQFFIALLTCVSAFQVGCKTAPFRILSRVTRVYGVQEDLMSDMKASMKAKDVQRLTAVS